MNFLDFQPAKSPARETALEATRLEEERKLTGILAEVKELVLSQDPITLAISSGSRTQVIGYDGTISYKDEVADTPTTVAERLQLAKERFTPLVNVKRDTVVEAGAPVTIDGETKLMDATRESRDLINGAVSMANIANMASKPFSIAMTLKDRSTVILDGPSMVMFGIEVGTFVATLFAQYAAIEEEIRNATTIEQVVAIAEREGLE